MSRGVTRKTTQRLAPAKRITLPPGTYDIYPAFPVARGSIGLGYDALASQIAGTGAQEITLDGFCGVFWPNVVYHLTASLSKLGISARFIPVDQALCPGEQIDDILRPYLGGDDPLF